MENISVRKVVTIMFAAALIIFTGVSMYTSKTIPEAFGTLAITVISYYYGKSTALDVPGNDTNTKE